MWSRADITRIAIVVVALATSLFAPWWVPVVCMIVLSLRFSAWEVPLIGLWVDLVWLSSSHGHWPLFTILGIALAWAATPIRRQLLL